MSNKDQTIFPPATPQMSKKRADLAPDQVSAFRNFSKEVFKEGALDEKTKQLIAVASAHITQCPYCIKSHTKQAKQKGASNEEIMEAIWVASEMRAGAAYAHAAIAIDEMDKLEE
ncbi:carboxymuconolactone decarboxylase family protein [Gracilimonas mengyeensis]|uniref:Alkylhydroperoxidase AhpD family core domain-containing protein n=1 Tax=Gracilimonas mengyeensis TaxID=1302730 RepID=A0A521D3C0_9BACT|nr:carboxymuconolactone decarboxylase family protein [Gracilimonas mengyeensis]SMO66193.1 alkylhydroperoxidase AhpD family core domain-containing protein [Gracilimonas mengyeensis]